MYFLCTVSSNGNWQAVLAKRRQTSFQHNSNVLGSKVVVKVARLSSSKMFSTLTRSKIAAIIKIPTSLQQRPLARFAKRYLNLHQKSVFGFRQHEPTKYGLQKLANQFLLLDRLDFAVH